MASIINATTTNGLSTSADNSGSLQLATNNGTTALTIDTSQKVGIGTASPTEKLSVAGSVALTDVVIPLNGTTAIGYTGNSNTISGGSSTNIGLRAESNMLFATGGSTERMRIDSLGSLLLNVTSNGYGVTGGIYAPSVYGFTTASAANMFIESGGFFRRSTSSIKYKTDVQDATHGLADVLKLRPVTYKGINDGETVFGGLIAEEVHEAGLTEFVQYADDGSPDALAYGQMVSLLAKAIQELNAKVEAQATRIAELEGAK